jgi:hypothetical protein
MPALSADPGSFGRARVRRSGRISLKTQSRSSVSLRHAAPRALDYKQPRANVRKNRGRAGGDAPAQLQVGGVRFELSRAGKE